MLQHPKILILSNDPAEADFLQETLSEHVIVTCARNMRELQLLLNDGNYDALFCSWSLHMETWEDPLTETRQCYPHMPVILLPQTVGKQEWIAALETGALDLLIAPYVLEQSDAPCEKRRPHSVSLSQRQYGYRVPPPKTDNTRQA